MPGERKRYPEQDSRLRLSMRKQAKPIHLEMKLTNIDYKILGDWISYLYQQAVIEFRKGNVSKAIFLFTISSLLVCAAAESIAKNNTQQNTTTINLHLPVTATQDPIYLQSNATNSTSANLSGHSLPTLFSKNNSTHVNLAEIKTATSNKSAIPSAKSATKNTKSIVNKSTTNSQLASQISKIPILFVTNEDKSALKVTDKFYSSIYDSMEKRIRRLLPYAMNNEVLARTLNSPGFKIYIRSPTQMQSFGKYHEGANCIALQWNPDLTDAQLLNYLSNECSHFASCEAMRAKTGNTPACLILSNHAEIKKAYNLDMKKVWQYQKMYKDYLSSDLTNPPSSELQELLNAFSDYQAFRFPLYLTVSRHQQIIRSSSTKKLSDGRLMLPKGTIVDTGPIDFDVYVDHVQTYSDMVCYSVNFAKDNSLFSKVAAFFNFIQSREREYFSGHYNEYQNKDEDFVLAEKLSDVEMFTPSVQNFFFKRVCTELSRFYKVEQYCSRPTMKP